MGTLLFILEAFLVLLVNVGFGYIISVCFYYFFFYPRRVVLFKKYAIPITPGLVYRKKQQLMDYLHKLIDDYLHFADRDYRERNSLTDYEEKIFSELFPLVKKFIERDWVPEFLYGYADNFIRKILWTAIRKFSRIILPRLLHEWHIYTKLDILDLKLDVKIIENYFNEYIYKYFLWFNLFFLAIVGFMNMIMFLLLA